VGASSDLVSIGSKDFVNVGKVVFLSCSFAFAFSAISGSIFRAICDLCQALMLRAWLMLASMLDKIP